MLCLNSFVIVKILAFRVYVSVNPFYDPDHCKQNLKFINKEIYFILVISKNYVQRVFWMLRLMRSAINIPWFFFFKIIWNFHIYLLVFSQKGWSKTFPQLYHSKCTLSQTIFQNTIKKTHKIQIHWCYLFSFIFLHNNFLR